MCRHRSLRHQNLLCESVMFVFRVYGMGVGHGKPPSVVRSFCVFPLKHDHYVDVFGVGFWGGDSEGGGGGQCRTTRHGLLEIVGVSGG